MDTCESIIITISSKHQLSHPALALTLPERLSKIYVGNRTESKETKATVCVTKEANTARKEPTARKKAKISKVALLVTVSDHQSPGIMLGHSSSISSIGKEMTRRLGETITKKKSACTTLP